MRQRLAFMNRKVMVGLLGILVLIAVFGHLLITPAEEYRFITWKSTGRDSEVTVEAALSTRETVEKTGTFQIRFAVAAEDGRQPENVGFKFDSRLRDQEEITVKTWRYNEENGTLTIYVSGTKDDVLRVGTVLPLGTITVLADSDVTLTVKEDGCRIVDENYDEQPITVFGSQDEYVIRKPAEETPTPEETTPEETTAPDETGRPDESTAPDETGRPDESTAPDKESTAPDETTTPAESNAPDETSGPDESTAPDEPTTPETPATPDKGGSSGGSSSGGHASGVIKGNDSGETKGTWRQDQGAWTFIKTGGSQARNEWIKVKGLWYWMGADGRMATGWVLVNNTWYYCNPSGDMKTGWVNTGDRWYFLDPSGAMKTGWVLDQGAWYYLDETGAMATGWIEKDGAWYYLDRDGRMLADTVTPDGARVGKDGARADRGVN